MLLALFPMEARRDSILRHEGDSMRVAACTSYSCLKQATDGTRAWGETQKACTKLRARSVVRSLFGAITRI